MYDKDLLTKSTAPSEEPTSGWMLHAIAKMTRESLQTCEQVEEFLISRLSVDSPYTKKKVFTIIKSLAQNGDPMFAKNMSRKVEELKKYTNYRGQAHELHGDSLNSAVRLAASEAIQQIFERAEGPKRLDTHSMDDLSNRIGTLSTFSGYTPSTNGNFASGVGSGNSMQGMGNIGTMGGGRMQGIGNPEFAMQNAAKQNTTNEGWAANIANKITNVFSKTTNKPFSADANYPGLMDPNNHIGTFSTQGSYQSPMVINGITSYGQNINNSTATTTFRTQSPSEPRKFKSGFEEEESNASNEQQLMSSDVLEAKVVEELTVASGVRAKPSRPELNQFVQRCQTLNMELICQALESKLSNAVWQVRSKALCGIEALLKANNSAAVYYFGQNHKLIFDGSNAVQESIQTTAQSILKLLNLSSPSTPSTSNNNSNSSNAMMRKMMQQKEESMLLMTQTEQEPSHSSNNNNSITSAFADIIGPSTTTTTTSVSKQVSSPDDIFGPPSPPTKSNNNSSTLDSLLDPNNTEHISLGSTIKTNSTNNGNLEFVFDSSGNLKPQTLTLAQQQQMKRDRNELTKGVLNMLETVPSGPIIPTTTVLPTTAGVAYTAVPVILVPQVMPKPTTPPMMQSNFSTGSGFDFIHAPTNTSTSSFSQTAKKEEQKKLDSFDFVQYEISKQRK